MPAVTIKRHLKEDPNPAFPGEPGDCIDMGHVDLEVCFLHEGMESGESAVGITFRGPDGKRIFIQTTYRLWKGCSEAFAVWDKQ